jgi:hypothetical protein
MLDRGAANRDPRQFKESDQLNLKRLNNQHLAFSAGPHFCIGNQLARLEGQVALQKLLQHFPQMKLTGPKPEFGGTFGFRGLNSLPITLWTAIFGAGRFLAARGQTLPRQLDGLNLSIHWCRWRDKHDAVAFQSRRANQIPVHEILDRRNFHMVDDLVAVKRVSPGVSEECFERLGLLLDFWDAGERLSPAVADQRSYSAVAAVSEKAQGAGAVRRFVPLASRRSA